MKIFGFSNLCFVLAMVFSIDAVARQKIVVEAAVHIPRAARRSPCVDRRAAALKMAGFVNDKVIEVTS